MQISLIAIVLMTTSVAACSAEQTAPAAETEVADASAANIAEIADDLNVPVYTGPVGSENVAVSGYDTVSYSIGDGTPVEGSKNHRVRYNGVEYHFANGEMPRHFRLNRQNMHRNLVATVHGPQPKSNWLLATRCCLKLLMVSCT